MYGISRFHCGKVFAFCASFDERFRVWSGPEQFISCLLKSFLFDVSQKLL